VIDLLADAEVPPRFAPTARRGTGLLAVVASPAEREALGLNEQGALKVSDLLPALPAQRAGLQVHDFITALDGRPLDPSVDERAIHEQFMEKGRATVAVRRRGASLTISIIEEDANAQ
jgi:S1-C subfamily serine protease